MKRISVFLAVLMLCFTLFTACGKNGDVGVNIYIPIRQGNTVNYNTAYPYKGTILEQVVLDASYTTPYYTDIAFTMTGGTLEQFDLHNDMTVKEGDIIATLSSEELDEEITVHEDGSYNSRRPSYWGLRHRFNVSLTGSVKTGRFGISLRERWQYTYRPRKTTERYDYDNGLWEDYNVRGKGHNVLRSRLKVEYDIPGYRIDPYASAEMYNSFSLEKSRYIVGAEWKITRTHSVGLYYLYQNVNNDKDDDDTDEHVLGLSYRIKL